MANLDFYADEPDIKNILEFIFAETDCKIFEAYSEFDSDLREFKSVSEVLEAYDNSIGTLLLQLWSPSVSSNVIVKKISLDPQKCDGATYRFRFEGWGLVQLNFRRIQDEEIYPSHFGHNSEKRARKWESIDFDELDLVDNWDWQLLKEISGKIQYLIRKKLAVSKFNSRPILEAAFEKHSKGFNLKYP